ncbi:MAG: hypothetical protein A3C79_03015 [Candidatus Taylorbacteria bacterium RIFCSPHIGHO2_02_FULL_45_28]|nr:MAG: hypothetical protein A3C79_03015 [Candidatus Taylorbacteria bacterium RIFCSPHIGHO2_02_FULL_45_28]OHA43860.1 MAG: hypothetical protein A3G04_03460 [Candidatus Taylorbacteria bacterium RIFCSPLOWO2_12_FULL_44_9]
MNAEIIIPTVILSADRSMVYRPPIRIPEWAVAWVFPELQQVARPKLDLGRVTCFSEYFVEKEIVPGFEFFEHLKKMSLISRCLNFPDGVSIAAYEYCWYEFKAKRVFLWQSVVHDGHQNLFVPWVQNIRGQMPIIYWHLLERFFSPGYNINVKNSLGLLV